MNYNQMAQTIIELVGGKENIKNLTHCVTRLRFVVKDESKVNADEIKKIENVINVLKSSGQYQVVLGPIVSDVFAEAIKLVDETHEEVVEDEPQKKSLKDLGKSLLDTIVSCFVPSISVIAGAE